MAALRLRALVLLCLEGGLRLSEALALRLDQVIADPAARAVRVVSSLELEEGQAKGREGSDKRRGYSSAGLVPVPRRARAAVGEYVREMHRRGWYGDDAPPPWRGPLFLRSKGRGEAGHGPWGVRAAQTAWQVAQQRAGIARPYRLHDLRHTAITRWAAATQGDPWQVAALARHADVRTSLRYVHQSPERLRDIAERAARRAPSYADTGDDESALSERRRAPRRRARG